jgi:DMSO/TMAO reductase YedYZ molybdopterin-dependent catalytic subunit
MKKYPEEIEISVYESRKKSRKAFAIFLMVALVGLGLWYYVTNSPTEKGIPTPLRKVLEANERVNKSYRSHKDLVPEYSASSAVKKPRVNGPYGMKSDLDTAHWKMNIYTGHAGADSILYFNVNDLKAFAKRDIIFDFKCIEGWSQITHWGGCLFSDLCKKYKLATTDGQEPDMKDFKNVYKYVGMVTPDSLYYVGIDMMSALHPQTILCYEMNGKPLPINQGAPLRLIIPTKYGVKNIKRIGRVFFSNQKPKDFWAEKGYDYDTGL